jgi:subtilisin family serine protease
VRRTTAAAPDMVNVMVQVEGDGTTLPAALIAAGFVRRTQAGNVVTGDLPAAAIPTLETMPGLIRAEGSRPLPRELDCALPVAHVTAVHNAAPPLRGAGVIVGMIDGGIDYQHRSFRKPDGTSRILAIWDQSLIPGPHETSPAGFRYGVEYTKAAIDAALSSANPLLKVRHEDRPVFHGTHVTGIAAGNGEPPDNHAGPVRFVGVAPEADIVVVANTRGQASDPGDFGDSADTLDAVSYILQTAERFGQAVAINISEGDTIGPHDGTSLLEVAIANLIQGAGRALIKSAGNEGESNRHAEGVLPGSGHDDVRIDVPAGSGEVTVDFWYPHANRIALQITPPGSAEAKATCKAPCHGEVTFSNGNKAFVAADLDDPGNSDNRIFVVLQTGSLTDVQRGTWTFHLQGSGPWHAWIQRDSGAAFQPPHANSASTISIPGTGAAVITVGSCISKAAISTVGTLSTFSSCGPTRDGRRVPTLCAPGQEITAPQPGGFFVTFKGTSMSAAMVTGSVALMFEKNKALTAADIRERLEHAAVPDGQSGPFPNNSAGAGNLNVEAACRNIQ